ncbi:hypothetical protein D0T12_14865 [Actinomadura spongiicola]|uniref:Uncharacterized protein n=1 Tax=Actinomadura spongiicola TaxID=2303421 RepID=A0A372GHF5_9ACTN|nr:hypothetical protein [Actinomadura spongiicola]RFS84800.1 hypothetical protein D0T12_14865 [Actinomadura spongiicola]
MSPTILIRRRAASGAITASALVTGALVVPVLTAAPAFGCQKPAGKMFCNAESTKTGSSGGGGGTGGGSGSSGPLAPPPPEGLTDNQAIGAVAVPGGAAPPVAAAPNTFELVQSAMTGKKFPVPTVHTAPDGKTYVHMRTSLWVEGFDTVRTEPIRAGDQTVQATAQPTSVTFDLGEKKLVCRNATSRDGTACHYTYKRSSAGQPGGRYEITATVSWNVTWTCQGTDCDSSGGDLGEQTMTSQPTPLIVGEIQTNSQ